LLEKNIRPRDIITKASLTNAMTAIAAIGGSTNGVLHILAVAREAGVDFTLRDVQAICRKTPVLCNFAPRGRGTMNDLHRLGGTTMLLKHILPPGCSTARASPSQGKPWPKTSPTRRPCPSRTTSSPHRRSVQRIRRHPDLLRQPRPTRHGLQSLLTRRTAL
jgi:dihydroxyacid dehydratase/phosphogluconate dehydratase